MSATSSPTRRSPREAMHMKTRIMVLLTIIALLGSSKAAHAASENAPDPYVGTTSGIATTAAALRDHLQRSGLAEDIATALAGVEDRLPDPASISPVVTQETHLTAAQVDEAVAAWVEASRTPAPLVGDASEVAALVSLNAIVTSADYQKFADLFLAFIHAGGLRSESVAGTIGGIFGAVGAAYTGVALFTAGVGYYSAAIVACGVTVVCAVGLTVVGALYFAGVGVGTATAAGLAIQTGVEYDRREIEAEAEYMKNYAFCLASGGGGCYPY